MITETVSKFIEKVSIKGAGRASAFIAYQPKTPEALRNMIEQTPPPTKTKSILSHLFKTTDK